MPGNHKCQGGMGAALGKLPIEHLRHATGRIVDALVDVLRIIGMRDFTNLQRPIARYSEVLQ